MADTYEKDLAQKSAVTISDYVRLVGTDNVSYKQPIYSMCAPYSNPSGTDLVSVVKALNQGTYFYRMDNVSGFPVSGGVVYRIVKTHGAGDARASILAIPMDTNANIYTTFITSASATSITWTAQPTRAEVDALTTVTTPTGATFSSKLSNTELTIRRCGKHVVGHAVFRADQALPANGETILTGLPYSDYRLQVMGICVAGSESYKTKRFAIYNGTLSTYWSGTNFISGDTWLVDFSYIATN